MFIGADELGYGRVGSEPKASQGGWDVETKHCGYGWSCARADQKELRKYPSWSYYPQPNLSCSVCFFFLAPIPFPVSIFGSLTNSPHQKYLKHSQTIQYLNQSQTMICLLNSTQFTSTIPVDPQAPWPPMRCVWSSWPCLWQRAAAWSLGTSRGITTPPWAASAGSASTGPSP